MKKAAAVGCLVNLLFVANAAAASSAPCSGKKACEALIASLEAQIAALQASLGTCNGNLGTCNANLGTCNASLTACDGNLSTCDSSLMSCNTSLTTCEQSVTHGWVSVGSISDCTGNDRAPYTSGDIPDPANCTQATVGLAAVCWNGTNYSNVAFPGQAECTYKSVTPANCTGGGNPGYMFVCQ